MLLTKYSQLKDGMRVKFESYSLGRTFKGRICKLVNGGIRIGVTDPDLGEGQWYLCDKNVDNFSWRSEIINLRDLQKDISDISTYEIGDILVDKDESITRVLGISGEVIHLSAFTYEGSNSDMLKQCSYSWTIYSIKRNGLKFKDQPPTSEITELTLDQISEKFGIPVDKIRIKKDE